MTDQNNSQNGHRGDEIEDLLPWHAAGRLGRADRDRVEAALARDPELARRLALAVEEQGETVALNETLGAPSGRTRDELFARIDAAKASAPVSRRIVDAIGAWTEGLLASLSPRNLAWSATAAALVIALQAGLIGTLVVNTGEPTFGTASHSGTTDAPRLLIGFAPEATAAEIAGFLQGYKASIVDGPRAGGIFVVRIGDRRLSEAELQQVVASMRAQSKVVRFTAASP